MSLFDDGVGVGSPDEGFGIGIGFLQEAVDGGLEIGDAVEHAAFEPTPGQLGEEALDRVEPGGGGRGEVEMKARVPPEPGADLVMFVRGVIVHDQMHLAASRCFAVDPIEEADELLMPVAAHALARIERFEAPIIEDEELNAGEAAQDPGIAAVAAGERELGEQLGAALIERTDRLSR